MRSFTHRMQPIIPLLFVGLESGGCVVIHRIEQKLVIHGVKHLRTTAQLQDRAARAPRNPHRLHGRRVGRVHVVHLGQQLQRGARILVQSAVQPASASDACPRCFGATRAGQRTRTSAGYRAT